MNSSSPMAEEVEDENFGGVAALKACLSFPATPDGHPRGLVRTLVVVLAHPGVHLGLPGCHVSKDAGGVEQFPPQRQVESLHLTGRRRRRRSGEPVGDPVVPADPVE
jgi:hypothetical protein